MRRLLLPTLLFATLAGCPGATPGADAGDAAPGDAADATADMGAACTEVTQIHSLHPGPLYVRAGGAAAVMLRLARDRGVCAASYAITSESAATLTAPATARIEPRRGYTQFTVNGLAPGRTRLRAVQVDPPDPMNRASAAIDVVVMPADVPACPTGTRVTGRLAPGARVAGTAGSPLEPASLAAPATVTALAPRDVTIECARPQVPEGYDAIGPAVTFGPGSARLPRELPFTLPINPSLVPSFYELHTEVSYTGPGFAAPRVVAVANTRFGLDGRTLTFDAPRLGTYQAVIRRGLGSRTVRRRFTHRGILGVSMGALGSSMLAARHPELFDFVVPLGGPADWTWFGDYFRRWHLGGFCTLEERTAMGEAACGRATNERTPAPHDFWVADQNFEHFNNPGTEGQGGSFDRHSYVQIMRDLTRMFGNAVVQSDGANGVLPLGVAATELTRPDAARCGQPVSLTGWYDDEYNPRAEYPVIAFCDGNRTPAHAGEWAGGQGNFPFEVSLAVDYNRNGVRDRGEPVIRNFAEPFQDVGMDGVASAREPGYDPVTNPDPAGDDYDRQYNPGGREGNFVRDEGEPFDDVGLDGVRCPAGMRCAHDVGEGNGTWDTTPGMRRFLDRDPRRLFATMPQADVHRVGVWADGGTRDLFNFGAVANHFVGAFSQRGESLHIYNSFSALVTGRPVPANTDMGWVFSDVDYLHLPRHVMMRYGFDDAPPAQVQLGDGAHVGTVEQVTNRLFAALWWAQAYWPDTDRSPATYRSDADNAGRCRTGYFCTFDFRSERANRTGPVSVYLPPGYHAPENAGRTYPVLYFLHGYGQQPQDLVATGFLVGNYMSTSNVADWQRPGKYIMVFPDGRCREGDGCFRGTFYTDSPNREYAQMETFFLDLYEYISRTYRARPASDVDVAE